MLRHLDVGVHRHPGRILQTAAVGQADRGRIRVSGRVRRQILADPQGSAVVPGKPQFLALSTKRESPDFAWKSRLRNFLLLFKVVPPGIDVSL